MQFSSSPNFSQQPKKEPTKLEYFFSQPHQSFFILGITTAIISVLMFALSFKGVLPLEISPKIFHTYSLFFITFLSFFVGFLFTTFPRFSQTSPIENKKVNTIFFIFLFSTIAFFIGSVVFPPLMFAGILSLLGAQSFAQVELMKIYKTANSFEKYDQFWILVGFSFGTLSHVLFLLTLFGFHTMENFGISLGFFNYLVFIAFAVGQRMIPFFSHLIIDKNRQILKIITALFIIRAILSVYKPELSFLPELIAGVFIALEIKRWEMKFFSPEPILWVLQLAILWLPVGLIVGAISSAVEAFTALNLLYLNIHLVALGFVMTVLIGFGTRVALGHSGNSLKLDSLTIKLFYFTQVVLLLRVLLSFSDILETNLMILFDISMFSWIVLFVVWSYKFFGVIAFGKKVK